MYFWCTSHFNLSASGILLPCTSSYILTKYLSCPTQAGLRIEPPRLCCSPTCEQKWLWKSELQFQASQTAKPQREMQHDREGHIMSILLWSPISYWGQGHTVSKMTPVLLHARHCFFLVRIDP